MIDNNDDCVMESERGALGRGSDPPQSHSDHTTGRSHMAGAGQASEKKHLAAGVKKTDDIKSLSLSDSKNSFSGLWGKSVGRRGQPLAP